MKRSSPCHLLWAALLAAAFGPPAFAAEEQAYWALFTDGSEVTGRQIDNWDAKDRPAGADPADIRDEVNWIIPTVRLDPAALDRHAGSPIRFFPGLAGWSVTPPASRSAAASAVWDNQNRRWVPALGVPAGGLSLTRTLRVGDLFNTAYPPEKNDRSVRWRTMPLAANKDRPWMLTFDAVEGLKGGNRVVYLRTNVYSPFNQPARLEMGSDDGIKVWINGQVVHSNNVLRPAPVARRVPPNGKVRSA